MFRRHGFFRLLLIGFLFMGLFSLIRGASYRSAWMEGFAAGQQTAVTPTTSEEAPPAAPAPTYHGPRGHWGGGFSPFFWLIGGFFKFLFFFMFIGLIFKLLRFGRFRHWRQHHHKEWKHFHHGHTPPWYDDTSEEPVMKA